MFIDAIHPSVFSMKVVQVPAGTARTLVAEFADYLTMNHSNLINRGAIKALGVTRFPRHTHINISDESVYKAYQHFMFNRNKALIQKQFLDTLDVFDRKLISYSQVNSNAYKEGKKLCETLFKGQKEFFMNLTPESTLDSVNVNIANFRKFCADNIKTADTIMGHGWLYRVAEVLIKKGAWLVVSCG